MPELFVDHAGFFGAHSLITWGTMLYPTEEEKRNRFILATTASQLLELSKEREEDRIEIDLITLQTVIDAPSYNALLREAETRRQRGIFAGHILLTTLKQRNLTANASKGKAGFAVSKMYESLENVIPQRREKEDWEAFKSVAHYWGAYIVLRGDGVSFESLTSSKFLDILWAGEFLRLEGEKFIAKGNRSPLLDPEKTWKVPEKLSLQHVQIDFPEKDEKLMDVISKYTTK